LPYSKKAESNQIPDSAFLSHLFIAEQHKGKQASRKSENHRQSNNHFLHNKLIMNTQQNSSMQPKSHKMNKTLLFVKSFILFSGVTLLLIQCTDKKNNANNVIPFDTTQTKGRLPIAYINVDTLLAYYQLAKDANEQLLQGQEDSKQRINARAKQLQADMASFENKMRNNAFLSREKAEEENNRLVAKQKELQDLNQQLTNQLIAQQQRFNEQLRDTINQFLKTYCPAKHYQIVLSTNSMNDNVLYAADGYDITKDVIKELNARYAKRK
jgi:outer membrane protein